MKSLAEDSDYHKKKIAQVELLGYGKVKFSRDSDGLKVQLPADAPKSVAPVLRIRK